MNMPWFFVLSLAASPLVAAEPPGATPAQLAKGKQVFDVNCAVCHGATGKGDGPGAAALNPKPRDFSKDAFKNGNAPENVFKTLQTGLPGTLMVSFAHLPEADRWALAHYVVSLTPGAGKADTKPAKATGKPSEKTPQKK